jgi:drug/metabolite transporter (DMT)-like permease
MASSVSDIEAVGFAVAGFTCWVLADTSIKMVGASNLPAYEVLAFLGLFIMLLLLLRGLWRREVKAVWPRCPKRQFVRSLLDLANNICVVIALRHLPLTMFYILVFMSPMVTTLLAAFFLHERLAWRRVAAIAVGFGGVVVAVDPIHSFHHGDWVGYAACMVCVASFSTNMVWGRVMTRTETPESLTFFTALMMAAVGFACMMLHAEPLTMRLTVTLVAMGLFCAFGSICFFIALKHTSAANVSQYHYTQFVTGALVGYLIWREKPTVSMLIGGAVIILSGVYIAMAASREAVEEIPTFPSLSFKD